MDTGRSRRGVPGALRRHRLQIAAIAAGALLVASAVAVVKPRDYRASTTLRVTGSQALKADQLAQRVEAVTREIVAPSTLETVATRLATEGLDGERLRAGTDVRSRAAEAGAFDVTISHTASDPELAARIVEQLSADYQASALQRPIELKQQQIARLEAKATEARDALVARRDELQRYVDENHSYLDGPEERLTAVRKQLREIETTEVPGHEAELARLSQLLEEEPELIDAEDEVRDDAQIERIRLQIRDAQSALNVLVVEEGRADTDPEVVEARRTVESLRTALTRVQNDVRTEKVRKPNPMHASLVKAKLEAEASLARARRKAAVLRASEGELLEEVRRAPDLRSERDRMTDALAAAEEASAQADERLASARSELAAFQQERPLAFATVAAPEVPDAPAGPNTLVIAGIGLLAGALLGVGAACVTDARDRSFRDARTVSPLLGLPTLGAIDAIRTSAEERQLAVAANRKTNVVLATGLAAVALLAFAVLGDATPLQDLVRSVLP